MDSRPVVTKIRYPEFHERTKWDWACLRECWGGTRITPSDVDAIVERNGYYLVIETKQPQQQLPDGQRILLEALSLNPSTLCLVVWGWCPVVEEMAVIMRGKWIRQAKAASTDDLRKVCNWWWRRANRGSR